LKINTQWLGWEHGIISEIITTPATSPGYNST